MVKNLVNLRKWNLLLSNMYLNVDIEVKIEREKMAFENIEKPKLEIKKEKDFKI